MRGEFTDFEGVFEIGENLESSRAYGKVKTASVDTSEDARDEHLRAPDFFNAEANPEITFESTSIEQLGDDVLKVTGDLTINGVTNEETFHAEVQGSWPPSVCAIGRAQLPLNAYCILAGGHVRTGLEDNLWFVAGSRRRTPRSWSASAASRPNSSGRWPRPPRLARLLGLPG